MDADHMPSARFTRQDWPARARIRGVAPIGIGTGWVEAHSGVLVRTAAENHLSVRRLVGRALGEAVADLASLGETLESLSALGRDLMSKPAASINGSGATARAWTRVLAAATLQPGIESGTTIPWAAFLEPRGLLRDLRAFCSACLGDWTSESRVLYEPLKWQFTVLEACPIHRARLLTACPTPGCGRARSVIAGWASVERCVACRRPFARPVGELDAGDPLTDDELDWATFVDGQLSDILANPPAAGEGEHGRFPEALAIAIESAGGGSQREFAARIGMTEGSVSYWKDGRRTPSLAALMRVSRAAGFGLRDLLLGDVAALRASTPPSIAPYVAPSVETHRALDASEMRRVLSDALVAEPPPSLASIYADARVDPRHVRRRYPRLCAAIRERHRAWLASERERVRKERIRVIEDRVALLSRQGVYPSRSRVGKGPGISGVWLWRPEFESAWREAVMAHGWGDPSRLRRLKGSPTVPPARSSLALP